MTRDTAHASRLDLPRAWLRRCNADHDCNKRTRLDKSRFPTRVLDISNFHGAESHPDDIRLLEAAKRTGDDYIALSHCWGNYPDGFKKTYCTTANNIDQRLSGFRISDLPKTFRDAIIVARALHIPYLWIDSLCIIQYGDNGDDWKRESRQMKLVFSQAYCVIAATAAEDSFSGFLKRQLNTDFVHVGHDHSSGGQFCMSTDVDDFDHHVGNATLNTRAWVMQEAVLARRIIHFSAHQTYWECGEGICCENFSKLSRYELESHRAMSCSLTHRF